MRGAATLEPWLTRSRLKAWVRQATTADSYRRRLVIWLTDQEHTAPVIASALQVSTRTVRRLIERYNASGPEGLEPQGWGGRRRGYLTSAEEQALLRSLLGRAHQGRLLTREHVRADVEALVGHAVSTTYLGELLRRGEWRKVTPRPLHKDADPDAIAAFKKTFPPCFAV